MKPGVGEILVKLGRLPYEVREMVYYHIFDEGVCRSDGSPLYSRGPEELRIGWTWATEFRAHFEGVAQFLDTSNAFISRDMCEYLKHTTFVIGTFYAGDFLQKWCHTQNTTAAVRKLRIKYIPAYFECPPGQLPHCVSIVPELSHLEEVVLEVRSWDVDLHFIKLDEADESSLLRRDSGLYTLACELSKIMSLRKVKLIGSDFELYRLSAKGQEKVRDHKMLLHKMRDMFLAVEAEVGRGKMLEVKVDSCCHLTADEVGVELAKAPSYACCVKS